MKGELGIKTHPLSIRHCLVSNEGLLVKGRPCGNRSQEGSLGKKWVVGALTL